VPPSLDLDSSDFERYGTQEGALKGYNPKKRGRPSHHSLFAMLAEARCITHVWLRSGNTASARGATAFLAEALALLVGRVQVTLVRAGSENRIKELRHAFGADGFCSRRFAGPEAALRFICLLYNLVGEFQRSVGQPTLRALATLRTTLFACGAVLGVDGR
jgi:hypothetical protein